MNLGILTFHSQLNYGGILQCWALKTALTRILREELKVKSEECDVVVIDRWLDERNAALRREFAWLGWRAWMKLIARGLLGCGDFGRVMRTIRTIRFVRGLGLSKEHFCDWSEIKQSSNQTIKQIDLLVVGSDQVWHCGDWGDPRPYLLEGAPKMRAIAYAASFGLKSLPENMHDLYSRGLERFGAISCREREGVEICRGLGFGATHVVDPTLLLDPSDWRDLAGDRVTEESGNRRLVCYFMDIELSSALPLLETFARKMNCSVEVLTNHQPMLRPIPRSIKSLLRNFCRGRVRICRGYGPKQFVRAFAGATWTLTDSYHAVMFSSAFNCNARFVRPANEMRRVMFARVEEFAERCVEGPFFVDRVATALSSFERGETVSYDSSEIASMREASMRWLTGAVKG